MTISKHISLNSNGMKQESARCSIKNGALTHSGFHKLDCHCYLQVEVQNLLQCVLNFMCIYYVFFTDNPIAIGQPRVIKPFFDPDNIKKVETTLRKVTPYLSRASANSWWQSWLQHARQHNISSDPIEMQGNYYAHVLLWCSLTLECYSTLIYTYVQVPGF